MTIRLFPWSCFIGEQGLSTFKSGNLEMNLDGLEACIIACFIISPENCWVTADLADASQNTGRDYERRNGIRNVLRD